MKKNPFEKSERQARYLIAAHNAMTLMTDGVARERMRHRVARERRRLVSQVHRDMMTVLELV